MIRVTENMFVTGVRCTVYGVQADRYTCTPSTGTPTLRLASSEETSSVYIHNRTRHEIGAFDQELHGVRHVLRVAPALQEHEVGDAPALPRAHPLRRQHGPRCDGNGLRGGG